MRRAAPFLVAAALVLAAGCRDDGARNPMTDAERETIRGKTDARTLSLIEKGDPAKVAVLAVFAGDAFLGYAQVLEERGIPVLNEFGPAALLLASGPEARALASVPQVRRLTFFSGNAALARIDPVLELSLLKRAGEEKASGAMEAVVRFGRMPGEKEGKALADAGLTVGTRSGASWTVIGPAQAFPRILDMDGVIYLESVAK